MSTPEVFERMRADHRNVLREIEVLDVAAKGHKAGQPETGWPGKEVERVLAMLTRQFNTHMAAEDEVLFPALIEALPETRTSVEPLIVDHEVLRTMLAGLLLFLRQPANEARDEQIAVRLRDLTDSLRIHVRKEEALVIGIAERVLSEAEVKALALRMSKDGSPRNAAAPRTGGGR